jgi:magnesium chelatase subunit I
MGSEIRTHYPATVEEGMAITAQEAWTERGTTRKVEVPDYLREVVEQIAFLAREDKRVDRRSGVSQRLPIACLEAVVSNAEQRAARNREGRTAARMADVYAAAPAITGKLELEYEGELKGADNVAREIIRTAVGKVFSRHLSQANLQPVIQWFEIGGELKLPETAGAAEELAALRKIQGLLEHVGALGADPSDAPLAAAAGEFLLEGLWAQKRISRDEQRGYYAERPRPTEQREPPGRPPRRPYN